MKVNLNAHLLVQNHSIYEILQDRSFCTRHEVNFPQHIHILEENYCIKMYTNSLLKTITFTCCFHLIQIIKVTAFCCAVEES